MGDERFVTVDRRTDGVAVVRLDRPKVNALSAEVLAQLEAVAEEMVADPPGAVVVWGGRRLFAAGADLAGFGGGGTATVGPDFHRALGALASVPRVTVAAINGYALGGGLELALACDLRVCAQDARLGLPEVLLGVIPGGGGTQRLPRLIGPSRAKDLIFSGRQVGAEEALAIGLVNRVVPPDEVLDAALTWAADLARGAVLAQALAKAAIDLGLDGPLAQGLAIEETNFGAASRTEDARTGVASFLRDGPGRASFAGR